MTFLRYVAWTVVVFISVSVTAVIPAHAQAVGDMEPIDCPVWIRPSFSLTCSLLTVPEDHANPDGPLIQIAVGVSTPLHSRNLSKTPLIYLEGGPGYGVLDVVDYLLTYDLFEDRIVYFVDQRGTGYGAPLLACNDFEFDRRSAFPVRYYAECAAAIDDAGINRSAFTSAQMAHDVAALVDVIGYRQVDLYGVSYGSRIALTVMRDHPSIVRSVILDSPLPLQVNMYEHYAVNGYRAMNALFDACAADSGCAGSYPNLAERFYDWVDSGQPLRIERFGQTLLTLRSRDIPPLLFRLLYDSESISVLPKAIGRMLNGESEMISALVIRAFELESASPSDAALQRPARTYSDGVHWSVMCTDEVPFNSVQVAETLSLELPVIIRSALFDQVRIAFGSCRGWGVPAAAELETEMVVSTIPTLVLSGGFDPITPPSFAEAALEGLARGQLVRVTHAGHGIADLNACVIDLTVAFLQNPKAPLDMSCLDSLAPEWALE